jgi:hypothetical protein
VVGGVASWTATEAQPTGPGDTVVELDASDYSISRTLAVERPVAFVRPSTTGQAVIASTDLGLIVLNVDESDQVTASRPTLLTPPESANVAGPDPSRAPHILPVLSAGAPPSGAPSLAVDGGLAEAFREMFDGTPSMPEPFRSPRWDESGGEASTWGASGHPRNGIGINMESVIDPRDVNSHTAFSGQLIKDFSTQMAFGRSVSFETVLEPSATRRDHFQLRISRTHIKFGLPDYNLWWIDDPLPEPGFDRAVVQFTHQSLFGGRGECVVNGPVLPACPDKHTWHWDNVQIEPGVPFTLLHGDQSFVDATTPDTVNFDAPAPADAHLRFIAGGHQVEVSFDAGASWQAVDVKPQWASLQASFASTWTPVPAGTTSVRIRGYPWFSWGDRKWMPWLARGFSVWAPPGAS